MDIGILKEAGVNYDAALVRFLGDAELLETVLGVFLQDETVTKAAAALENSDYHELFNCTHALKGMAGNLDMSALYEVASEITEMLRHNDIPDEDLIREKFAFLEETYQKLKEGIIKAKEA